jgi:hypothetical protein
MSKRGHRLALAGIGLLMFGTAWAEPVSPPPKVEAPAVRSVSGPFTHGNLTVYLLHGADVLKGKTILTLQDALAQKKAIVHETSNVNQLSVENTSDDALVFIQSGDIVKGGKQDRAIAFDMLLPPKSGLVGVGSFCCESGRWKQRAGEAEKFFAESNAQIAGNGLKRAVIANDASKQGEVWQKVGEAQGKLSKNVASPVADSASPSSLQLTLENKKLQEKLTAYEKALAGSIDGKNDVIGVALCVNGKVEGAEVYGSNVLFQKLWPKLLKSAATDALAEMDEKKTFEPATTKAVEAFLAEAVAGAAKEVPLSGAIRGTPQGGRNINDGLAAAKVRIVRYDGSKVLCVECQDRDNPAVIHRCYIAKEAPKTP